MIFILPLTFILTLIVPENPNYTSFFTSLVRSIVSDTRQKIILDDLDLQVHWAN